MHNAHNGRRADFRILTSLDIIHKCSRIINKHLLFFFLFFQTMLQVILGQLIRSRTFQKFDYDSPEKNLEIYGSIKPPLYKLENIQVPIIFHYAISDMTTNQNDVELLYDQLKNVKGKHLISDLNFSHVDFLYSIFVKESVYDNLIRIMQEVDSNNIN